MARKTLIETLDQVLWEQCASMIGDILNTAIHYSPYVYRDEPMSMQALTNWFLAREAAGGKTLCCREVASRQVLGFATWAPFRSFPGSAHVVEHSLYVAQTAQREGLGSELLVHIGLSAKAAGKRTLIGVIDASNFSSRRLHERHGFALAGSLQGLGFKFGVYRDALIYQRQLHTDWV